MGKPDDEPEAGGFLNRWARRKQEAQQRDAVAAPEPADEPTLAPHDDGDAAAVELPLPSLEDIVPGADVSAFFQKHVPEALRTAALRKLWVTDPAIRDFIEMADYQWDFNNPDAIPGWSSSVGDFDVQALVRKVLGEDRDTAAVREPALQTAVIGPQEDEQPTADTIREATETPSDFLTADVSTSVDANAASTHVAMQKTPDDSGVYVSARKRHGGALPT
ncbi:MAG: DUF3306 domain-containing protein [Beijerinckiaceae bacterium]